MKTDGYTLSQMWSHGDILNDAELLLLLEFLDREIELTKTDRMDTLTYKGLSTDNVLDKVRYFNCNMKLFGLYHTRESVGSCALARGIL